MSDGAKDNAEEGEMPASTPGPGGLVGDAFDRWLADNGLSAATPEERKRFLKEFKREVLSPLRRLRYLAADDVYAGPHPDDFARRYEREHGHPYPNAEHLTRWREMYERGARQAEARQRRQRDAARPENVDRRESLKVERELQRAQDRAIREHKREVKKSGKAVKLDPIRDVTILQRIKGFLKVGVPVQFVRNSRNLVEDWNGDFSPRRPDVETGTLDPTNNGLAHLPEWKKSSPALKLFSIGNAIRHKGGRAFTLNLGNSVIEAAAKDERGFAIHLRDRLNVELDRAFRTSGMPRPGFTFRVEKTVKGRPHLHGMTVVADRKAKKLILKALRAAGGSDWKPEGHGNTQAQLKDLDEPLGWASYCRKLENVTKEQLGPNVTATTHDFTGMGREWHERMRETNGVLLPGGAIPIPHRRTDP